MNTKDELSSEEPMTPDDLYKNSCADEMAKLVAPRVGRFVQRLMGIPPYEYSDGRYPGFSSEIIGCHYPLTDAHVEHINRVVVGHLMLRCEQLAYFMNRLDPTLSADQRPTYQRQLEHLGKRFRGEDIPPQKAFPLKQQLVFALAILHDIGKTAFLPNSGHEERGGLLVERILCKLKTELSIDDREVTLGRLLIENHTMLGTLVQGEQSVCGVMQAMNSVDTALRRHFLYYLLLLNSMDLSGYRYFPIVLDPYWNEKYIAFSDFGTVEKLSPEEFVAYRLRELARVSIPDVGQPRGDAKRPFHDECKNAMDKIGADVLKRIGTIRIRDALYLLLKINTVGTGRFDGFSARYAPIYVRLFQVLARIPGAETVVFKGDGSDNEEADSRLAGESRIRKLLDRLQLGVEDAIDARTFTANSTKDKETWFTIAADGRIIGTTP